MQTPHRETIESDSSALTVPQNVSSSTTKLVYVFVTTRQVTTIDEICSALRMKRLTLFGVLPRLLSDGYVARDGDRIFVCDD
jgi:hypothetical protein